MQSSYVTLLRIVTFPFQMVRFPPSSLYNSSNDRIGCAILETKTDTQPPGYNERTSAAERLDQTVSWIGETPASYMKRPAVESEPDKEDEEAPATGTTNLNQEKPKYKERHNARLTGARSHKPKTAYQQELEESVRSLTTEKEIWKTRALTLRLLLQSHGVSCPDFEGP